MKVRVDLLLGLLLGGVVRQEVDEVTGWQARKTSNSDHDPEISWRLLVTCLKHSVYTLEFLLKLFALASYLIDVCIFCANRICDTHCK